MLTNVWGRLCTVGRIACASTWEEATSVLTRPVHPTTSGILSLGMSCLLSPDMLLRSPSSSLSLTNKPCLWSRLTHRKSVAPGGCRVTVCSFLNEWARNELIVTATAACQGSLPSMYPAMLHLGRGLSSESLQGLKPALLWNVLVSVGVVSGS